MSIIKVELNSSHKDENSREPLPTVAEKCQIIKLMLFDKLYYYINLYQTTQWTGKRNKNVF